VTEQEQDKKFIVLGQRSGSLSTKNLLTHLNAK